MVDSVSSGTIETVSEDIGTTPSDVVARWRQEIDLAEKYYKKWKQRAEKVLERYRDEKERKSTQFNILWSNTETMKPALYGQTPTPDVRRRIVDPSEPDAIAKDGAIILERALAHSIDDYDFDSTMEDAVEDYLLPGRGNVRVRYVPTMALGEAPRLPIDSVEHEIDDLGEPVRRRYYLQGREIPADKIENRDAVIGGEGTIDLSVMPEDQRPFTYGEPAEEVVYEEVRCEYVYWDDYLESPAKCWEQVRWVAYRSRLTRKELRDQYPDHADKVELDWAPKEYEDKGNIPEFFKRATVWEIWDKEQRKVIAVAKGYDGAPLKTWDDPLKLDGFFPQPKPLDFVTTNDSRVPIPVYSLYQDQAQELDRITGRINVLMEQLKIRGVYDGSYAQTLENILSKDDGHMVPVDNYAELQGSGGLERIVAFLPIEQIILALRELYIQRENLKQAIHEIIGLSDIMRGATNPNETKGAQVLKAEFGQLRLQNPQMQVQRFVRDVLRLKAEIMAEHFSPEILSQIAQKEVTPEILDLLRSQGARSYRIDIETDSTIQVDAGESRQESVEMIQAVTGYLEQSGAIVQQAPQMGPFLMQLLRLGLRQFKPGRLLEETLDEAEAKIQQGGFQPPSNGEAEKAQMEAQMKQQELQFKGEMEQKQLAFKVEVEKLKVQMEQAKLQASGADAQAKLQTDQAKLEFERQKHQDDMALKREEIASREAVEREKLMAQYGPSIMEHMEKIQQGIGDSAQQGHEAMTEAARQNTEAIMQMVQAMQQQNQAIMQTLQQFIEGQNVPKEIVFEGKGANRRPVGIRPSRTLQ